MIYELAYIFAENDLFLPLTATLYRCCRRHFPLILKIHFFHKLCRLRFSFSHSKMHATARFYKTTAVIL
jgi:hypothetical protein